MKAKRPIPWALGVQNAARFTKNRHEKLTSQLNTTAATSPPHWTNPIG